MTSDENAATVPADETPASDSTVVEHREGDVSAQGRGAKLPEGEQPKEEDKKHPSTREAIAKAFDEAEGEAKEKGEKAADDAKAKAEEAKEAEKEEKPDKDAKDAGKEEEAKDDKAKPQRGEDGKFAKADKPEEKAEAGEEKEQPASKKHNEPPARFLPEAREKWANVPTAVKADFHRIMQEVEAEGEKNKEAVERYETLRQYDETAKQNGRDLKDSLEKVAQVEQSLARNPIAGLDAVLREIGPRKQDGSPLTLMDVAQFIAKNPQAYQQQQAAPAQAPQTTQQQPPKNGAANPEIEELRAEVAHLKAQPVMQTIGRFADSHPDYHALEGQIEKVLKSGVIDQIYGQGLSPEQKLAEAYRMAGGREPSSQSEPEAQPEESPARTARPVDPDGQKSINGAPTAGQTGEPPKRYKSNREALEAVFSTVR